MKTNPKINFLILQVLLPGAAAALRGVLYLTASDEKNLLVRGHPAAWLLWLVCAAAAVLIPVSLRKQEDCPGASPAAAAAGSWIFSAGIVLTVLWGNGLQRTGLVLLWTAAGILAAAGLIWAGLDRIKGKQPNFLIYCVLCLFLSLHMVSRYQPWSGNPQVQDWIFSLLAAVGLTLCAYHHGALAAGNGYGRLPAATQLLTVVFCCAALPHTEYFALYLCGGIWAFTNLPPITAPTPKKTEPAPEAGTETE